MVQSNGMIRWNAAAPSGEKQSVAKRRRCVAGHLVGGSGVVCHAREGENGMTYAAFALILLGFAIGMSGSLRVLVSALVLLLVPSVAVSFACGFGTLDAAVAVMAVQTIVQSGFFGGSLVREVVGSRTLT